jgi:4-hydroxy-tetrahydrodipicolinate reductase
MRIALVGYGKMGKAIEAIAIERGHTISHRFDAQNPFLSSNIKPEDTDIAIEFTQPNLAVSHIEFALKAGIPIVVGTTAWQNSLDEVLKMVEQTKGSLLHASNFSVGVNLFFALNEKLAQLMSNQNYDASILEIHHLQKLDAPSGTAVSLANGIFKNHAKYSAWTLKEEVDGDKWEDFEIPISAVRTDEVPGTHTVTYTSEIDSISITHEAFNRKGFATGAVIAAEFLLHKKGAYTMSDVLNI